MRVKSIKLQNFMCFQNTKITLPHNKMISVYGYDEDRDTHNGTGKSSFKEAIIFGLFGRSKVNLSDIITKGQNECVVDLVIQVNNKDVRIVRKYKRNAGSSLDIYIDKKKQELKGIAEKNKFIQSLINFNYDQFVNFSIFDIVRFLDLSELSAQEIKKILNHLFNYEKIDDAIQNYKQKIKGINTSLEMSKSPISHYYSDKRKSALLQLITRLNKQKSNEQKKQNLYQAAHDKLIKQIAERKSLISKNNNLTNWLSSKNECPTCGRIFGANKEKVISKYQDEVNKYTNEITLLSKQLNVIDTKNQEIVEKLVDINNRIFKVESWIRELNIKNKFIQSISKLQADKEKYELLIRLLTKFSLFVLQKCVCYIETMMNKYLEPLTDIRCKVTIESKETLRGIRYQFNIRLLRNKQEFSYMQLSSGERLLVAYAFKLSINTINFKQTFLFVDEGLSRLDVNNRKKLYKLFKMSPFSQVFTVSHDLITDEDKLYIFARKKNNVSVLDLKRF